MEPAQQGHLDATTGREVVFCHLCRNEWYHDTAELICPHCESEAIEIISPDSDPREALPEVPAIESGRRGPQPFGYSFDVDSDPDEADIEEEILTRPDGVRMQQRIFRSGAPGSQAQGPASGRPPFDAQDGDAILSRFRDMLTNDFRLGHGQDGGDVAFGMPRTIHRTYAGPGYTGGTTTSVTFASGPIRVSGSGAPLGMGHPPMGFNEVFGGLMAGPIPPPGFRTVGGGHGGDMPPPFISTLQELLSNMLNPHNAIHGDAVYSQEALDRIITSLMEANPQSNAAPPASRAAMESLPRKKLDEAMLGSEDKSECIICLDEMPKGDEVVVLPCKHWFHPSCVFSWLEEHNTCPICRQPMEGSARDSANAANATQQRQQQQEQQRRYYPDQPPPNAAQRQETASAPPSTTIPSAPNPAFVIPSAAAAAALAGATGTRYRREHPSRTASENAERLAAIRNAARPSYNMRRNSLSPPSPGVQPPSSAGAASDYNARTREAWSPSWSPSLSPSADHDRDQSYSNYYPSRFGQEDVRRGSGGGAVGGSGVISGRTGSVSGSGSGGGEQQQRGTPQGSSDGGGSTGNTGASHGPLSWIRDQFARHTSGGPGGSRP